MKRLAALALAFAVAGMSAAQTWPTEVEAQRHPSIHTGGSCLIRNGIVVPVTGPKIEGGDVLIKNGKIVEIGKDLKAPAGVTIIDAKGKYILPGIVDAHSHRGESESNEWTDSIVADTQIRDVLQPDQLGLWYDLANGITTGMLLHGSADAIGGQSIVVKHKWLQNPVDMVFPDAPRMMKFALGENVTQKSSSRSTRYPRTRMGVESVYRRAFSDAKAYMKLWDDYKANPIGAAPRKDQRLEALADVLRGKIWIQCHSYRQDEMLMMARLAQEYGFHLGALQHALESYKIAPELAESHTAVSMFADAWDYKIEVYDAIPMAVSICLRAGVVASVNTDTFSGLAPLNIDAAKSMRYGISENEALRTITMNPAIELGVDKHVGSLEVGKDGDVSIWIGNPLSVYSKCALTLVDGEVLFQRRDAFKIDDKSTVQNNVRPTTLTADQAVPLKWSETYAIVGADIHTGTGDVIEKGTIVIDHGKVAAVGADVTVPANAVVVQGLGLHVYPGFFDAGTDLGLNEIGQVSATQDSGENGPFQPDLHALTTVNPESAKIPIGRCAGVTTAMVAPNGGVICGQGAIIDLAGYTKEQMAISPTTALIVNFPDSVSPQERAFLPAEALEKRESGVKDQRDALKDWFGQAKRYAEARKADPALPLDAKLEAMVPYVNGVKPTVLAVNSLAGIKAALALAKEMGLKPILGGAADAWKMAKDLSMAKIPVVLNAPTTSCPGANQAYGEFDPYDSPLASASVLQEAGVKFALSGNDSAGIANLANSAGMLCAFGLSQKDALRTITLSPAEIFGVSDQLGSLEKGKIANVVITDGDPMEITTQTQYVFIGGKPIQLKSKWTELYRKYERRLTVKK